MEHRQAEEKMALLSIQNKPRKGGLRTMPFIIVNESFERLASYGLMPNMILYLMTGYQLSAATGSNVLFIWSAVSNGLAIVGAFLSDSYLGRFRVIALGSFSSLLGTTLLWLTAMFPQLKPPPCDPFTQACKSASPSQLAVLFTSFGLMSIGAGCVRPCSISFGADQLDNKENPNNERVLQSFLNWYYASIGVSTVLAMTIIVYIQDKLGWRIGFGIPALLMLISALIFVMGSVLYVKVEATKSLFTGFVQVIVVAFKNRKLTLPQNNFDQHYHSHDAHDSNFLIPTDKLRWLNKACIIRNPQKDLNPDGSASNPWSLCTVEKVESFKALLRVIPMWSTGIMIQVTLNQGSFTVLQAQAMDRHLTSKFEIPAGSFSVFMVSTLAIWVAFYDRIVVPFLAKHTGRPRGLSTKLRMGIGLLLSCLAMAVAALVEAQRRRHAIDEPGKRMSAMWLVPQFAVLGLAEAFNSIGQTEFFYSEFPRSMSSIAVAIFTLGMAVGSLVASLVVDIVDSLTSKGAKENWLSSDINKGHLDYYYWLLACLSLCNFLYFLGCCWAHGPSKDEEFKPSTGAEKPDMQRDLHSS